MSYKIGIALAITYCVAMLAACGGAIFEAWLAEKVTGRTPAPLETFCGRYLFAPLLLVGATSSLVGLIVVTALAWMDAL